MVIESGGNVQIISRLYECFLPKIPNVWAKKSGKLGTEYRFPSTEQSAYCSLLIAMFRRYVPKKWGAQVPPVTKMVDLVEELSNIWCGITPNTNAKSLRLSSRSCIRDTGPSTKIP